MGCLGLTIAGGVVEVIGLGMVALKLWLVQRHELGIPPRLARLLQAVRLVKPKEVSLSGTVSAGGKLTATVSVERPPALLIQDRLDVLEKQHAALRDDLDAARKDFEREVRAAREHAANLHARVEQDRTERDQARLNLLRATHRLDFFGWPLFLAGVVLSVLGDVVTC